METAIDDRDTPTTEAALCPNCLHPNDPSTYFCVECHTPMRAISEIDPIGRIHAEMDTYRKATHCPPSRIVLIGMWLICLPPVLGAIGFLCNLAYAVVKEGPAGLDTLPGGFIGAMMFVGSGIIFGILLFRASRNYFGRSDSDADPNADNSGGPDKGPTAQAEPPLES